MPNTDGTIGRGTFALIGGVALLCALLVGGAAAEAQDSIGNVTQLVGAAQAEAKPESRKLEEGAPIFLDDLLRTGEKSRLAMLLGEKTTVRLGAQARLRIDRYIADVGGELNLERGPVFLDAQAGSFPKGLDLHSPFGLIAVRGTSFFAGPLDGEFAVFVRRGKVRITAGGAEITLRDGQGSTIRRAGEKPSPSRKWMSAKIARAMAEVE